MKSQQLQQICSLNKSFNGINAAYAELAKIFGLNYNAFMIIYNMEQMEKCTQKGLCDSLMLSKSTVHSILLAFIEKGLVTLEADTNNKKERIIVPTEEGAIFFRKVCKDAHEIEKTVMEKMGDKKYEQYLSLSREYETILKKQVKERQ